MIFIGNAYPVEIGGVLYSSSIHGAIPLRRGTVSAVHQRTPLVVDLHFFGNNIVAAHPEEIVLAIAVRCESGGHKQISFYSDVEGFVERVGAAKCVVGDQDNGILS